MNKTLLLSSLFLMPFQFLASENKQKKIDYFNNLDDNSLIKERCQNLPLYHKIPLFKSKNYKACNALHEILKRTHEYRKIKFSGGMSSLLALSESIIYRETQKDIIENHINKLLEDKNETVRSQEADKFKKLCSIHRISK